MSNYTVTYGLNRFIAGGSIPVNHYISVNYSDDITLLEEIVSSSPFDEFAPGKLDVSV